MKFEGVVNVVGIEDRKPCHKCRINKAGKLNEKWIEEDVLQNPCVSLIVLQVMRLLSDNVSGLRRLSNVERKKEYSPESRSHEISR